MYLLRKRFVKPKYQSLTDKCKLIGQTNVKGPKPFIEDSKDINDVYPHIDDSNSNKICKMLIVSDDLITDTLSNKKIEQIVTELFIRCRKLNNSLAFITKFVFFCTKKVLTITNCF